MKIKIYAIGKMKNDFFKQGVNEYQKRLKPYVDVEIIELQDEAVRDNASEKEIEIVKNKEGQKVLKLLKTSEYLISLDLDKKQLKSPAFAEYLQNKLQIGGASISFVIGGSYGLSDELKSRANDSISLSQMTFLHTMTRLILLEQIYRAFKIINNETYHK